MGNKRKRQYGQSIFRTIMMPMIALLIVETVLIVGVPLASGMIDKLSRNEEDILAQQVENRKNYLENAMISDWADLQRLSSSINEKTQQMLDEGTLTLEDLNNSEQCSPLLLGVIDDMITELYAKRVNGIYVMFNTRNLEPLRARNHMPNCTGLYIRDLDPESTPSARNSDLLLKRAPTAVVRAMNISTDSDWKPMYMFSPEENPENYDFLYQPFQVAYEAEEVEDPADFGFWAPANSGWYGSSVSSMTYSQPLVLEDGTVYGVLGVELLNDYLRTLLPYHELAADEAGSYALARVRRDGTSIYMEDVLVSSTQMRETDLSSGMELVQAKHQPKGFECTVNGRRYYVAAHTMTLYGSNTPFEDQEWVLFGLVDTARLYRTAKSTEYMLGISVLLMILFGILGSVIIGRRLSIPVRRLSGEVYWAQATQAGIPKLSKTGIDEIDHFSAAITELSRDVVNTSTRFLRIIDMATAEIGGFEVRQNEDAFITDNFFTMLGIPVDKKQPVTMQRFHELMRRLEETTPHSERSDGSTVYEIVQPSGDIRFIRISASEQGATLIGLAEDVTTQTMERKRIEHDRDYDQLTGLRNRRAFYREVETVFRGAHCDGFAALVMLDLDDLKRVNDNYGHEWGDQYLQQAARGFMSAAPGSSVLARLAGDEFALFVYGYDKEEDLRRDVTAFEDAVRKNVFIAPDGNPHRVQVSGGVAWYPENSTDFYELMKYADFAMYQIKHGQKGSLGEFDFGVYNQESYLAQNRREFQQLLEQQLVQYHFQPIFSAKDGSVFAYEALMRVNMPTLRTPDAVLNLARKEERLKEIERLSMLKSTEYYQALCDENLVDRNAYLFVNSIADQYIDKQDQQTILDRHGELASRIVIEITECNAVDNQALSAKRAMECFSGMFALDDYGSGYNGEKNLLELSPKFVKLDICIVRGIDIDTSKQHIVSNLISYARARDMLVIAEGLETTGEICKCLELGVDLLQGYALARPAAIPTKISHSAQTAIEEYWTQAERMGV